MCCAYDLIARDRLCGCPDVQRVQPIPYKCSKNHVMGKFAQGVVLSANDTSRAKLLARLYSECPAYRRETAPGRAHLRTRFIPSIENTLDILDIKKEDHGAER